MFAYMAIIFKVEYLQSINCEAKIERINYTRQEWLA